MAETSPQTPPPRIELTLSISPSTHSFSNALPPTITMTLVSHAPHPITLFTWDKPLDFQHVLTNNGITITNLTSNTTVKTTRHMIQRTAITRLRGSYDEILFPTLEPEVATTFSRAFGRNATLKPLPKHMIKNGWELDAKGNEMRIRRSVNATGVDGLEAGCSYRVGVNIESLNQCRWAFATKEEVLVDRGSADSSVGAFPWEKEMKIDWIVHEAVLNVTE
jgi:hypothetical protein